MLDVMKNSDTIMLTFAVNVISLQRLNSLNIVFGNPKFESLCNNHKLLVRKHGTKRAKKIRQRLDDLHAANSLDVMRKLPGRCHELAGDKSGFLSLDLDHPYRLLFEPANEPLPQKDDGGIDWVNVTAVRIIGIEDTHG